MAGLLQGVVLFLLGSFVTRVLVGAGLTLTVYQLSDSYIIDAANQFDSVLSQYDFYQVLMLSGLGDYLSIVFSALSAAFLIRSSRLVFGIKS